MQAFQINGQLVVKSLQLLSNPTATAQQTKQANAYLLECERTNFSFLALLLEIFEKSQDLVLRLQALLYFNNILKRNWNNKRQNKHSPNFESDKASIKLRLVTHLRDCSKMCLPHLLDVVVFISKYEFPHNFEPLNTFIKETYRNINQGVLAQPLTLNYLKSIRKVYKEQLGKKSFGSNRIFQEVGLPILAESFQLFTTYGDKLRNPAAMSDVDWKMLRSNLKVLLAQIATAPPDILEKYQEIPKVISLAQGQLEVLAQAIISGGCDQQDVREQAEKTLKSFIEYLGYVQQSHNFLVAGILKQLLVVLSYVFLNHRLFRNLSVLKFSISLLNRIIKCFNYYADEAQFMASQHSRQNKSLRYDQLHNACRQTYHEVLIQSTIENLLSHAITNILSIRQHELEVGSGVQEEDNKIEDKDNTIFNLTMFLIDSIFVRFSPSALQLFGSLLASSIERNFSGLDDNVLNNIFSVLSIVPKACRTSQLQQLKRSFPITASIQFIHSTGRFKDKFALLCCKWLDTFGAGEIRSILEVLLQYLQNQQRVQTILECCLAVKNIILSKPDQVDLGFAVQKILPVAIGLCRYVDSTQVLWPMITLITKIISKVECVNHDMLLNAFSGEALKNLLAVKTQLIVQALCEMIKSLLCIFPRNRAVPVIFMLAADFLDNHLGDTYMACFPSVLGVWYIAVREYSPVQNINQRMVYLFDKYFSKLVGTQQQQLLYILEEYVLLGLIPSNIATFLSLLNDFYSDQPEDREETVALKTAVLSVHITFITKFGVDQAHSNELLVKYLTDMNTPDTSKSKSVSAFRNSLLTLINRYLILFKEGFLGFVGSIGLSRPVFVQLWLAHMEHLTSRNACKINVIALLHFINDLDPSTMSLQGIMKLIVPEVEVYLKNLRQDNTPFFGGIAVSPSNRMSENILSERKQQVRRVGVFETIDLKVLYQTQMAKFVSRYNLNPSLLEPQFLDKSLPSRIFALLQQ